MKRCASENRNQKDGHKKPRGINPDIATQGFVVIRGFFDVGSTDIGAIKKIILTNKATEPIFNQKGDKMSATADLGYELKILFYFNATHVC